MTNWVRRLWNGEIGLARSFWEFGIAYGTLIHLIATGVAFGVLAMGGPIWIAAVLYFLPAPYAVLVVVGVWRSAARYQGPAERVALARFGILVWAVLATVL